MTPVADATPIPPGSCPFLGLPDDPATRFSFPSTDHRCWAAGRPRSVDVAHQGVYCLSATHPECSRYKDAVTAGHPGAPVPEALGVILERVQAQDGAPGGQEGRPPRRRDRRRVVAVVVVAGVVLAGAAYAGGLAIADRARQGGAGAAGPTLAAGSPSTAPVASPTPTPSPTPVPATPTPSAMPSATPSPTPVPSAEPTRTPKPVPTPLVHVVTRGETLTGIAAQYGVTVAAIRKANGIKDPNLIHVGDHLVIPRP